MAECVLCGARIGRNTHSREHVFPEWLEKLFIPEGDKETVPYVRRFQTRDQSMQRQEWQDIPFNMRVKALCKPCNEQWCNEIETEAKPLLIPLICNQPLTLDAASQTSLAVWATKTLLMLQLTHSGQRSIADDLFRWFREHRWPLPNEQVWIGQYDGTGDWPVSYRHYGMLINEKGAVPNPPDQVNAHISAIGVGHLVFLLFGHTIGGGLGIKPKAGKLAAAVLRPIWPALGGSVAFPPTRTVAGNAGLDGIASSLGNAAAFHERRPQVSPDL